MREAWTVDGDGDDGNETDNEGGNERNKVDGGVEDNCDDNVANDQINIDFDDIIV